MQVYLDNSATTRAVNVRKTDGKSVDGGYGNLRHFIQWELWRNVISKRQKSGLQKH